MIPTSYLPTVNAALNSLSAAFLVAGYIFIKRNDIRAHKVCMLSAFSSSVLFLISYLFYHYEAGSVPFEGQGWIRTLYFTILISHTVLAAAIVPLVLITLTRALKGDFDRHRRIARWTLPLWFYVSLTGVVVYAMLYKL